MSIAWNGSLLSWGSPGGEEQTALGSNSFHPPLELSPDIYWVELILLPLLPLLWDR